MHDSFNFHKKVKELTEGYKKRSSNILTDDNGDIILDTEIQHVTYVEKLFKDERSRLPSTEEITSGPERTEDEVEHALKNMKTRDSNEIFINIIKILLENHLHMLSEIFNIIYKSAKITKD